MKNRLLIVFILLTMMCAYACSGSQETKNGREEEEQADLIETEEQLVQHCKQLGTISEIPDPGKIIQPIEDHGTKKNVMERARRLGATHIVWLNKNKAGYIVGAYQCPDNE